MSTEYQPLNAADALIDSLTTAVKLARERPVYFQITTRQGRIDVRQVEFLSVEELAQLAKVEPRTVHGWVQRGIGPPSYRPPGSRSILFDLAEAVEWIRQNPANPSRRE